MKQETLQLTGGAGQSKRRELDFYPTPRLVTVALMEFLNLSPQRTVWEPACGNYAMSKVIEGYGNPVISTDIIYGDDYLSTSRDADVIITNPPFSLSEQFIRKVIGEARIVAMLLKSQYWHSQKRLSLFNEFTPAYILPLTWRPDFLEHERTGAKGEKISPTMEVIWTVWNKSASHESFYKPLPKPPSPKQ